MIGEAAPPDAPHRHGRVLVLGLIAVVVLTAGGLVSWFATRGGCGGHDYVTDQSTRLCYAIPDGWREAAGASPGVLEGTATGEAYATVMSDYTGDGDRLAAMAAEAAGVSRDDPLVRQTQQRTETATVDGHRAMVTSLRYELDGDGPTVIHVRLSAVEVEPGRWSLLTSTGFSDDEAAAVDEIHDGLDVLS